MCGISRHLWTWVLAFWCHSGDSEPNFTPYEFYTTYCTPSGPNNIWHLVNLYIIPLLVFIVSSKTIFFIDFAKYINVFSILMVTDSSFIIISFSAINSWFAFHNKLKPQKMPRPTASRWADILRLRNKTTSWISVIELTRLLLPWSQLHWIY